MPERRDTRPAVRSAVLASYILSGGLLLLSLRGSLLAGLLAACLGVVLTRGLAGLAVGGRRVPLGAAATLCIIAPLVGLTLLLVNAKGLTTTAFHQFPALLEQLARTVIEFREKLPEGLAVHVPEGAGAVQAWLAAYLKSQAKAVASMGQSILGGLLLAYVGIVVGSLAAAASASPQPKPLAGAIRQRAANFLGAFRQVVAAQFWIAAFNTFCTAVFLLAVLPFFEVSLPYSAALILFTFVAGLVPIVGNLVCNGVLSLVGMTVSPLVGSACLGFLIGIHKFEYFINARVVGTRTSIRAWELLAAMFIGEALAGIPGLVAAPLYFAYVKKELREAEMV